jgi:cyclic pyranopterin phosphate synthase
MRCVYCRPAIDRGSDPAAMDADDLVFLVDHLHRRFHLRKLRLTGGEPTIRADLTAIIRRLASLGIDDLAMTTNGLTLAHQHTALASAGLRRVNVSIDSLDADRFASMTGVDGLDRVVRGIDAVLNAGNLKLKLNTVVVAGQNEDDLCRLLLFAADREVTIRFIELMPMGPLASSWQSRYVPATRMRAALSSVIRHWHPIHQLPFPADGASHDAARLQVAELRDGRLAEVGFITPMSDHFCETCDRLRITADGGVYPCLMDEPRGNLTQAVHERDTGAINRVLAEAYAGKSTSHPPTGPAIMTHLGG